MQRAPYPAASRRTPCHRSGTPALRESEREPGECYEQRHHANVHELGPELKPIGFDPQVLANLLQLDARLRGFLAEVVDLRLLLGRQYRALCRAGLALLELLELLLR